MPRIARRSHFSRSLVTVHVHVNDKTLFAGRKIKNKLKKREGGWNKSSQELQGLDPSCLGKEEGRRTL